MSAYYNEIDPYAAQWLRNLIAAELIADGEVDERSIIDVRGSDLRGFTQCHFFAGIGVWTYALRLAGWPDDRPVWTGSCPCQPFSAAGRKGGLGDERHLWPHWQRLIGECHPDIIFGEQVASGDGLAWLDFVCADLEAAGYAVGAVDTCAAGFGAPHIRQRLYFVADSASDRATGHVGKEEGARVACGVELGGGGELCELADSDGRDAGAEREQRSGEHGLQPQDGGAMCAMDHAPDSRRAGAGEHRSGSPLLAARSEQSGAIGDVEHAEHARLEGHGGHGDDGHEPGRERAHAHRPIAEAGAVGFMDKSNGLQPEQSTGQRTRPGEAESGRTCGEPAGPGAANGFWRDADWLPCIDGKARPVEPGTFPLAHGSPGRVGRLRAYGNCICAPQAAEFIRAYLEGLCPSLPVAS